VTAAAVVFCCTVALAFLEGFGAPAFVSVIASDAFGATMPFLGILVVARFVAMRRPASVRMVHRVHATAQGLLATMSFGWRWVEPHALLTVTTGGSLAAMAWLALLGAVVGLLLALLAERASTPTVAREVSLGAWVLMLIGGGRLYRALDHIEAGTRLGAAAAIVAGTLALAWMIWLLLRRRERLAAALPALAPACACLALLFASRSSGPVAPSGRDSIILVVVDTLRADIADGSFGADRNAMPELKRIAEAGVRFTQAVSPAPWTLPATVSVLGGWNPQRHRFGASASPWEVLGGDPAALYTAAAMRDAGYLTAAFVHNPWLRPYFGFDDGFYAWRPYHGRALDGVALALDWLRDHLGAPSFSLLHLMDPHWPYDAPAGFGAPPQPCDLCDSLFQVQFGVSTPQVRAEVTRRYAAEVHYTDAMLGRFYDTLVSGGALDHTWLIITSDHGEELWDHGGFLHGHSLFDELLRVPLVVVPPRADQSAKRGLRVDAQVRLEDVAATMLEIGGLEPGLAPDGQSLLGMISGGGEATPRVSVGGYIKSVQDLSWSIRRPPWKAIQSPLMTGNRLFNLVKDAGERRNLLFDAQMSAIDKALLSRAFFSLAAEPARLGLSVRREPARPVVAAPDADTRRQLESLGYVQ